MIASITLAVNDRFQHLPSTAAVLISKLLISMEPLRSDDPVPPMDPNRLVLLSAEHSCTGGAAPWVLMQISDVQHSDAGDEDQHAESASHQDPNLDGRWDYSDEAVTLTTFLRSRIRRGSATHDYW